MRYQIEFEGRKLGQTDCASYVEARSVLFQIVQQCIQTYRQFHADYNYDQAKENNLQSRIFARLKIRPVKNDLQRAQYIQKKEITASIMANETSARVSQIHRSYVEV